jgi:pSer/pThr/pTyr-binding forkhead associated (FHA) protein
VIVAAGRSTPHVVSPGQRVVIGSDPAANIVLDDPRVSPGHVSIERRGPGWLVNSLDPANPAWILDATGRAQPIETELGLRSGELAIGGCQVMLYTPSS